MSDDATFAITRIRPLGILPVICSLRNIFMHRPDEVLNVPSNNVLSIEHRDDSREAEKRAKRQFVVAGLFL
jgi:hypothetical protein